DKVRKDENLSALVPGTAYSQPWPTLSPFLHFHLTYLATTTNGQVPTASHPLQCDAEDGARAFGALDRDGLMVRLHDVLHDGQAQAGAAFVTRTALSHPIEALEHARQMLLRHADAVVGHLHHLLFAQRIGAHRAGASLAPVDDRIVEQVR